MTLQDAEQAACRLFGDVGKILPDKEGYRVGYFSSYGFHVRGRGATLREALMVAWKARNSDDPTPESIGWLANDRGAM